MKKSVKISLMTLLIGLFILVVLCVFSFSKRDLAVFLSSKKTYMHSSGPRKYILSANISKLNSDSKLIFALHGLGDSAKRFAYYTGLHNAVGENDIVVYPEASPPKTKNVKPGWNSGFCCGSGWVQDIDDSSFISSLATELRDEYGVSEDKLFIAGFSNGAFMAQWLAVDNPSLFKAITSVSGTIGTTDKKLQPSGPVSILLMHGRQDQIVNFDGGVGKSDPNLNWLSFEETKKTWEHANQNSAQTRFHVYENLGHQWNDWRIFKIWNNKPEASQRAYSFFDSVSQ